MDILIIYVIVGRRYEDLEIYRMSYKLALNVHKLISTLPKNEYYEEGSQIRRSSKSITVNIA